MEIENEIPEEVLLPLEKIQEKRWRTFICTTCGTQKTKWMFWISEADAKANKDHRQQCGTCNKILPHKEIFPTK